MAQEPDLTVHVRLDDRTDLSGRHAVQGVLFAFDDESRDDARGYRGTVASRVAGITYRQLDYWARKKIVEPSVKASHGSGTRRLYSFKDIVILAVSKRLLDTGVNLQNVTTAIGYLSQRSAEQLEDITIMCDGETVYECTDDAQVGRLMRTGKAVFGVSVGSLWHEIRGRLESEDYVDVVDGAMHHPQTASDMVDELALMRERRRRENIGMMDTITDATRRARRA